MIFNEPRLLGIENGGTKLQLVAATLRGRPLQHLRFSIDPVGGAAAIRKQITAGWKALEHTNAIAAIGVGFGGPVDWTSGTVRVSHQVDGWADFGLAQWLEALTQKPVAVENDANAAALAEARLGAGRGHRNVFYLTAGSGVGGGLVANGALYHGRTPGEAEAGHLRLNKAGDTLESKCSGWAVDQLVATQIKGAPEGLLARLSVGHNGPLAALLPAALQKNDAAALRIVSEVADNLAFGLSHVVHLFHPDILVLGGGLSLLGPYLLEPVQEILPSYLMHAFKPAPPLVAAALGEGAVPAGALELARNLLPETLQTPSNSL